MCTSDELKATVELQTEEIASFRTQLTGLSTRVNDIHAWMLDREEKTQSQMRESRNDRKRLHERQDQLERKLMAPEQFEAILKKQNFVTMADLDARGYATPSGLWLGFAAHLQNLGRRWWGKSMLYMGLATAAIGGYKEFTTIVDWLYLHLPH